MLHPPATRPAPAIESLYEAVQQNLDPGAGDIAVDRLMQLFRRLSDLHDTDVSSPFNMGYFCIDADAASVTAMDETNRRGANIGVVGQHPAAVAFEQYSIDLILTAFGFDAKTAIGHFTACGTEANMTAMIVALTDRLTQRNLHCPAVNAALCSDEAGAPEPYEYWRHGTAPLGVRPAVYVAPQTHGSIGKNARNLIGAASLREVAMDDDLRLDPEALDRAMAADAASGNFLPFMVVGTVGATPSGIVDPLAEIGEVCAKHGAWFHVDAPWGGIAAFSPRLRQQCLDGLDAADSLIFDPHKTLAPLGAGGAGMFLSRHREPVELAFNVSGGDVARHDYAYLSLQGSRANTGLRVLTSILRPDELARRIEGEAALGDRLRALLKAAGWEIVNETPLPVICAIHPAMRTGAFSAGDCVRHLNTAGVLAKSESLRPGEPDALRLGVISRRTDERALHHVVECLSEFVRDQS
ncbi:MAG: pyridoxal-dependent decarboxylase [Proteobacteria bacterium]|nr:pyridoxal-dependent decarboxylase [Pseudomonadota bacterium]MDA1354691.1 pyridoxal-dependent decarboxylase [Pseudomonadota bacterium]